jgi:GNAT superfamily N-acetyltransferase
VTSEFKHGGIPRWRGQGVDLDEYLKSMKSSTRDKEFLNAITVEPLGRNNWQKLVKLFGEKGACGNCWCMYYRLGRTEFEEGKTENGNREAFKTLVWDNRPTGMLAIYEEQAIAWCAFAPREDFIKLERSRVHKRIDGVPVWSIPCFFIHKDFRRQGVSVKLLQGVIQYARQRKIEAIEAYPTLPPDKPLPDSFAWIGLYSSFEKAGFRIVDHKSKNRPMVRYVISD